jgi:hypothetical protein
MGKKTRRKKDAGHAVAGAEPRPQTKVSAASQSRFSNFLANRPCLRDAILWSIPAILLAALLHSFIIYHTPLAYWSKDSWSFLKSADQLLSLSGFGLDAKRRWVYPIFLVLPHALPGATLWWVKVLQTALTLCSVIAFGYIVRKTFVAWKFLIIPATLIYALHPHFIYYTGQVLAESLSLNLLVLSIAGWAAWIGRTNFAARFNLPARFAPFLLFFVPFALFILTKPSHRFVWPGLIVAFFLSGSWRSLRWPHLAALATLLLLTPTVGKGEQGLRLFYTSAFPLTQLDTAGHSDYKDAIAPLVEEARKNLPVYAFTEKKYKNFLEDPDRYRLAGNRWAELKQKHNRLIKNRLYMDLALEGITHAPHLIIYIALQRILGTHLKGVAMARMQGTHLGERLTLDYYYPDLSRKRPQLLRKLFGWTEGEAPDLNTLQHQLAPHPDTGFDEWIARYGRVFESQSRFLKIAPSTEQTDRAPRISDYRPTALGILLILGTVAAFFAPYRATLGAWALVLAIYLLLVFCVGSLNPRFLLPAEPLAYLLALLPFDVLLRWLAARFRPSWLP